MKMLQTATGPFWQESCAVNQEIVMLTLSNKKKQIMSVNTKHVGISFPARILCDSTKFIHKNQPVDAQQIVVLLSATELKVLTLKLS